MCGKSLVKDHFTVNSNPATGRSTLPKEAGELKQNCNRNERAAPLASNHHLSLPNLAELTRHMGIIESRLEL
jgi:hypothetical protein